MVARAKAVDMAGRGYFNPVNPEGFGPNQLAVAAGYRLPASYSLAAANDIEVNAAGYDTLTDTWALLLASGQITPLLGLASPYATQTQFGVGYAYVPTSTFQHYWVFEVAEPAE
jgi:uncharacterized protein YkwD